VANEATLEEKIADRIAAAVIEKVGASTAKMSNGEHGWPELMTIETAAAYMDRTVPSVRLLMKEKVLASCKLDRHVRLRRADFDRLIERHTS
jgi:excisionase family DNA binding protein